MRYAVGLVVALAWLPVLADGQIEATVPKSVVQVNTPPVFKDKTTGRFHPGNGTGLIVGRMSAIGKDPRFVSVLITNKHMIGNWNPVEGKVSRIFDWIELKLYKKQPDPTSPVIVVRVPLKTASGTQDTTRLALHSDDQVDLVAVRFDLDIPPNTDYNVQTLDVGYLVPFDRVKSIPAGLGDMVFALGYPSGITSIDTNRPIAKVGHLAATPGEALAIRTSWDLSNGKTAASIIRGKLFLIDGLIVGGNSGGPVLLPAGGAFGVDPATGVSALRFTKDNRILGIVSSGWAEAGLAIAYSGDYVLPLIDALFPPP